MNHFFDIGANVGQTFTDYLNKHPEYDGWTVWCFEPSPRNLPGLFKEVQAQQERYRIRICPFGISGATGLMRFYMKSDDCRGDSFFHHLESDHVATNMETQFDLYCATHGISDFILTQTAPGEQIVLKLDSEGSEYATLLALLANPEALARVTEIHVEWHGIKPGDRREQAGILDYAYRQAGKPLRQWMF